MTVHCMILRRNARESSLVCGWEETSDGFLLLMTKITRQE